MPDIGPILEFSQVRFQGVAAGATPTLDLALSAGELALVTVDDAGMAQAVADAAQGLHEPEEGFVRFLGQDWQELSERRAVGLRGRAGRVSSDFGWISNLDLEENVLLGQRHRTTRPQWEIRAEARRWAQAFGLPEGIPAGRPATIPGNELRRAACVRAFLGDPALIVVDATFDRGLGALQKPLIDASTFVRGRRTAILWLADQPGPATHAALNPSVTRSLSSEQSEVVVQR